MIVERLINACRGLCKVVEREEVGNGVWRSRPSNRRGLATTDIRMGGRGVVAAVVAVDGNGEGAPGTRWEKQALEWMQNKEQNRRPSHRRSNGRQSAVGIEAAAADNRNKTKCDIAASHKQTMSAPARRAMVTDGLQAMGVDGRVTEGDRVT